MMGNKGMEDIMLENSAIVFRLAHYMQNFMDEMPEFEGYVLDCEYNRNEQILKNYRRVVYILMLLFTSDRIMKIICL